MSSTARDDMQVADDCFQVGRRNPQSLLQCNTYLRVFRSGKRTLRWCIDPGSRLDYPQVRENLLAHVESLAELDVFSINHQDPDVVGNLTYLTSANEQLLGLATEDTWRLVRHLNAAPKELRFVNTLQGKTIRLPGGHLIRAVPTPFCHFRGAMAFYDPEIRVLYTGDLFGGLNEPKRVQLLAHEEDWPGIAIFHQIYMPTRAAVAHAIRQIRALDPPVRMIAPQHGFVLAGDFMHDVMERLERLPVGLDRLPRELDDECLPAYRDVFQQVVEAASAHFGPRAVLRRLAELPDDHELRGLIQIGMHRAELVAGGIRALPLAIDVLSEGESGEFRNQLKSLVLRACLERDVPLPQITPGSENGPKAEWIG